ncbi:MAG: NmrA family NAD(P)-binding protein [Chloroflexota bacterium]
MILVTGASGKTGQAVTKALVARHADVRSFARSKNQVELLKTLGATSVMVGDLWNRDDLVAACQGIETIYHICPNMHPEELLIGQKLISAATETGVSRIVYHSVLHPQTEEMPHHWLKLRMEELLFKSGLDYTILQPAAYMQNVLASWSTIQQQGIYEIPYAPSTRLGMVDLQDVAQAAAWILTEEGHGGATYELAGREVLTQNDIATILSEELRRSVTIRQVKKSDWTKQASSNGLSPYAIETLLKMFAYYEAYGFWGNPTILSALLGRGPTMFREFIRRTIDDSIKVV